MMRDPGRAVLAGRRGVDLGAVVDAGDERDGRGAARDRDRARDAARGPEEQDALGTRDRELPDRLDRHPFDPPVRDRRLEGRAGRVVDAGVEHHPVGVARQLLEEVRRVAAEHLGQHRRGGLRVRDDARRRDDGIARARRGHLAQRPRPGRCRAPRPCPGPRPRPCPRRAARRPRCRRRTRASRPIAPSSVATWAASRIGVSTPPAPVRSSSAIVVSSTHSSPDSVPMYSWSESGSNATALAPGTLERRRWACGCGGRGPRRRRRSRPTPGRRRGSTPRRPRGGARCAASRTGRRHLAARRHVAAGEQRDPAGHRVLREVRDASTRRSCGRCRSATTAGTRSRSGRGRPRRSASGRARRAGTCGSPCPR